MQCTRQTYEVEDKGVFAFVFPGTVTNEVSNYR